MNTHTHDQNNQMQQADALRATLERVALIVVAIIVLAALFFVARYVAKQMSVVPAAPVAPISTSAPANP